MSPGVGPSGSLAIRDSKDPAGPVLRYTPHEWECFIGAVKSGEFDHLVDLL